MLVIILKINFSGRPDVHGGDERGRLRVEAARAGEDGGEGARRTGVHVVHHVEGRTHRQRWKRKAVSYYLNSLVVRFIFEKKK